MNKVKKKALKTEAGKNKDEWEIRPVRPLAPGRLKYRKGLFASSPPADQDPRGPGRDGALL